MIDFCYSCIVQPKFIFKYYSVKNHKMKSAINFDVYVIDSLMRDLVGDDHSPSAFLVYL
jgi:hypothetical protein